MQTNFFQSLAQINTTCAWNINITPATDGTLMIAVLLNPPKNTDNAAKLIPPMTLKGTPQELDEGFFNSIEAPAKVTANLFVNMQQYTEAQAAAKEKSREAKDRKKQREKTGNDTENKYELQMKKVEELAAQQKYGEAIMQLPKPEDFPDNEDEIEEKKQELWDKREEKENTLFK